MKPIKIILAMTLGSLGMAVHAADTFKIDPVHSSVVFSVTHLGVPIFTAASTTSKARWFSTRQTLRRARSNVTIPVESVDTHNEKRDQHLKSPDFFNAKQFPVMTFKSKKVESSGDTYKVTGDFTLHGVTKPLTLEIKKGGEGQRDGGRDSRRW